MISLGIISFRISIIDKLLGKKNSTFWDVVMALCMFIFIGCCIVNSFEMIDDSFDNYEFRMKPD